METESPSADAMVMESPVNEDDADKDDDETPLVPQAEHHMYYRYLMHICLDV